MIDRPNPGSDIARAIGCTCPVDLNHGGQWFDAAYGRWIVTEGCPVHTLEPVPA